MSIMKIKDLTEQIRGVSYKPSDVVTSDVGLPILRANKYKFGNKWIVNYDQLLPHLKKINRRESKMWKKYMQCLGIKNQSLHERSD